jgi:hypothetical protein
MRFRDSPGPDPADDSDDEVPGRPEGRDAAAGLAERLLRLPAEHPSGRGFPRDLPPGQHVPDGGPAPADGDRQQGGRQQGGRAEGDPEQAVSHPPWPDDWVRHEDPPDPEDAAGDAGDPEPQVCSGQPETAEPGTRAGEAGHPAAPAAEPWGSLGPYRPWFATGDLAEPWFTSEPDGPSSGPGG